MTLENFSVKVCLSEVQKSISACCGMLYQGLSQLGIRSLVYVRVRSI